MAHTILTIDDAKAVRLLAARTLTPFECEVTEASNGFNAFFASGGVLKLKPAAK